MLKQHGILHYDIFKLSNNNVPMDGFDDIAKNTFCCSCDDDAVSEPGGVLALLCLVIKSNEHFHYLLNSRSSKGG